MVRRNSKNREDEQRLSGETVSLKADKTDEKVNILADEEWDTYSGLPNPSWYETKEDDELG